VTNTLDDLTRDTRTVATTAKREMAKVVRTNTKEGNRIAKAFASEQHTMFGDTDIEYPPSFTWEMVGPLTGEYGPDAAIGDGSQASGYEFGSINSPPHFDLARSVDQISHKFVFDVQELPGKLFWPGAR
jgi:hypothetical protein